MSSIKERGAASSVSSSRPSALPLCVCASASSAQALPVWISCYSVGLLTCTAMAGYQQRRPVSDYMCTTGDYMCLTLTSHQSALRATCGVSRTWSGMRRDADGRCAPLGTCRNVTSVNHYIDHYNRLGDMGDHGAASGRLFISTMMGTSLCDRFQPWSAVANSERYR
jgi:hypothetical protein